MQPIYLWDFVRESNRIEGITREPTTDEVGYTAAFVGLSRLTLTALTDLVGAYQPNAKLRRHPGMDVRVGNYYPPKGGTHIERDLLDLLVDANESIFTPWQVHIRYESLHPFTDGNGRSGRAIWLWQMLKLGARAENWALDLGFLHSFYYQTLQEVGR